MSIRSQWKDDAGLLQVMNKLSSVPHILKTILSAASSYDYALIQRAAYLTPEMKDYLTVIAATPPTLLHLSRLAVRRHFDPKHPEQLDELQLPTVLVKYLRFEDRW